MKKSQIIYFVLGGLVLLFIFLSIFFFSQNIKKEKSEFDIVKEDKIEQSLIPLDLSLRTCFYKFISTIIRELGETGGLVDEIRLRVLLAQLGFSTHQIQKILDNIRQSGVYSVAGIEYNSLYGDRADYVNIYNLSRIPIYYRVEFSKGPKYRFLRLEIIEKNIEKLAEELIPHCVQIVANSYKDFSIEAKSNPKVDILFKNKEILATIEYKLEIKELTIRDAKKKYLQKFSLILDVPLKEMVHYSNKILEYLINDKEFEKAYMNYVSAFRGLDLEYLPPQYEISNKLIIWDRERLMKKFKDISSAFFSRVRIVNTKSRPFLKNNFWDFEISSSYIPYSVDLYYFYHDPVLKVYPNPNLPIYAPKREGGVFRLGLVTFPLPLTYTYATVFDYAVPVIFEIRDEEAFKQEGFSLKFAVMPSICRDMPCYENITYGETDEDVDRAICENGIMNVSFRLQLNPAREIGEKINVLFECGGLSCEYELDSNPNNQYSILLPQCVDGSLKIYYGNYAPYIDDSFTVMPSFIPFENYARNLGTIVLNYPKKIYLSDIELTKISSKDLAESTDLNEVFSKLKPLEGETYMFFMINKKDPRFMIILSSYDNYSLREFELIPGVYDVILILFKNRSQYVVGTKKNAESVVAGTISNPQVDSLVESLKNLYSAKDFEGINSIILQEEFLKKFIVPFSVWFSDYEPYKNLSSVFGSFCGSRFLFIFYSPGFIIVPPGFENIHYANPKIRNTTAEIVKDLIYDALEFEDENFLKGLIYVAMNSKYTLLVNCTGSTVDFDSIKGINIERYPYSIYSYNLTITADELYNSNRLKVIFVKNKPMFHVLDEINFDIPSEKQEFVGVHFIE